MSSAQSSNPGIEKTTLPHGIRVISEQMSHVRSVAVGVWIDAGSRAETDQESGISHFVEHMVFKGTSTRSADDIACSIDSIGGQLDAFTTKENVAFTAKVLDEHLPRALDVLSDLVLNPAFRDEDIVKEKGVVLEELKMEEDNPDYLIHEMFISNFWKSHPLGRTIIGTKETINSFQSPQLREFFGRTYCPSNLMITAAGNVEHSKLVELVEERFGHLSGDPSPATISEPEPHAVISWRDKPSLEQVHVCIGVPAYAITHPRRYAGYVLNTVLGGGISSRLFLKIREHEGLAYSVFSDLSIYSDTGYMSVYAGTSLETTAQVIEHVLAEFKNLKMKAVETEELRRAKDHLKGSITLSLESTTSRMSNLARQERYFQRFLSLDELNEQIEQVTAENLLEVANDWFHQERIALAVLGNLQGFQVDREQLVF